MEEKPQTVRLRYYGISPWEIEVIYNIFNEKFEVIQDITESDEYIQRLGSKSLQRDCEECVSALTIAIPLPFSEEFFKWFEFRAWDKVKHIIKEMKRRRGKGNAIIVEILFTGDPNVRFVTDLSENHNFNSAIEKMDSVVELLPYHLNDTNISNDLSEAIYKYDIEYGRWRLNSVLVGQKKIILTKK